MVFKELLIESVEETKTFLEINWYEIKDLTGQNKYTESVAANKRVSWVYKSLGDALKKY
jgi:hypothetical protein